MSGVKPSAGWTPERIAQLTKLWGEGRSAAEIARALGWVSRSAVLGKVDRLNLDGRRTASAPAKAPRPERRLRLPPKAPALDAANRNVAVKVALASGAPVPPRIVARVVPDNIALAPRPWITRTDREYTYPVSGEGADTLSCCNPVDRVGFCAGHAKYCLTKTFGGEEGWPVRAAKRVGVAA